MTAELAVPSAQALESLDSAAREVAVTQYLTEGSDLRPAVAAATYYLLLRVDESKAPEFFDRLRDGANLPAGSPILALRARLRAVRDDRTNVPTEALVSLVLRAWNAWRQRRSLTSLQLYRNGEVIPCPVPK